MRWLALSHTLFPMALLVVACGAPPSSETPAPALPDNTPTTSEPAPAAPSPSPPPEPSDTLETSAGPVTLTPIHHATLVLGFDGKTIVVDPWSEAPDGWLPKADLILITDNHKDHFDREAIAAVKKDGTLIVAPKVVASELEGAKPLDNGKELSELGVIIRAVPMYNNTRGPEAGKVFHEKGRGNGYLLTFGDKTIYLSGDTACTPEMKALKKVDLALVCMNLPYTMPPEEAAECVRAFKPKVVIPYHYRGSDLEVFKSKLVDTKEVEVRLRDFYRTR